MSTDLSIYGNVADPMAFVREFGAAMAKSRLFGCENESQGQVLAMACLCERQTPLAVKRTYHIMDGQLSMRADAMLADFRRRGGKHKVKSRTPDVASIEVEFDGNKHVETLSWEDAQKEPFVYKKDGKTHKTNWATPRARRQMLWARVCSEAVRTICPEVVAGVYTPEEIGDLADEPVATKPVDVETLMRSTAAKIEAAPTQQATNQVDSEPIDAEFKVVDDKPAETQSTQVESTTSDDPKGSSTEQRSRLRDLFEAVGVTPEQREKALAKRGAKSVMQLTFDQAAELIVALETKLNAAAANVAGESRLPAETRSADKTGAVTQTLVDDCKALMANDFELVKRVKAHLTQAGKTKLSDLCHEDVEALHAALKTKNLELFFARSLKSKDDVPFDPTNQADSSS